MSFSAFSAPNTESALSVDSVNNHWMNDGINTASLLVYCCAQLQVCSLEHGNMPTNICWLTDQLNKFFFSSVPCDGGQDYRNEIILLDKSSHNS